MGKMGNKYRFLTIGFLMIVIVGLMVLYHDVQYDNDLLTERKRLLSNQLQCKLSVALNYIGENGDLFK